MFHSSKTEFAIPEEHLELLEDCQYQKHCHKSPILIWPSVCKHDIGSLQSLKMYPELNKAAEEYHDLIYLKLQKKIGEGTYGVVYRAFDIKHNQVSQFNPHLFIT